MLSKDGELFFKKEDFEDIFNYYFGSIVGNINVEQWNGSSTTSSISNRFKNHVNRRSTKNIKEKYNKSIINKFIFAQ